MTKELARRWRYILILSILLLLLLFAYPTQANSPSPLETTLSKRDTSRLLFNGIAPDFVKTLQGLTLPSGKQAVLAYVASGIFNEIFPYVSWSIAKEILKQSIYVLTDLLSPPLGITMQFLEYSKKGFDAILEEFDDNQVKTAVGKLRDFRNQENIWFKMLYQESTGKFAIVFHNSKPVKVEQGGVYSPSPRKYLLQDVCLHSFQIRVTGTITLSLIKIHVVQVNSVEWLLGPNVVRCAQGWEYASFDGDHDGLSDLEELDKGTNPLSSDTDEDNIGDKVDADPLDPTIPRPPSPTPSPLPPKGESTATVLVMDVSGSMGERWKGGVKLESAKNAAQRTIDLIEQEIRTTESQHHLAIASFSSNAQLLLSLTTNYQQARNTIISLGARSSTNLGAGLQVALKELQKLSSKSQRFIILLSDGMTNTGMSRSRILSGPVAEARQQKICIHTVGFGDPGSIDEVFLKRIAANSGCGQYSYAASGFDLMNVYIKLRHISLGQKVGEFSSQGTKVLLMRGMTTTLGTVYIPNPKQQLYYTLSWSEGSQLRAQLVDPSGKQVTVTYPGANLKYFDRLVHIIVSNPQAGFWKVTVYGASVPLEGAKYYAILSTRPGGLAIPFALPGIICLDHDICIPIPGDLPVWLIVTISMTVLAIAIYLWLSKALA